jgi:hypothetical protein
MKNHPESTKERLLTQSILENDTPNEDELLKMEQAQLYLKNNLLSEQHIKQTDPSE